MIEKTDITNIPLTIEIPFEEYKELLVIKGKYEELKSQQTFKIKDLDFYPVTRREPLTMPTITYGDRSNEPLPETPYKITCSK